MKNTQKLYASAEEYGRGVAVEMLSRVQSGLTFYLNPTESRTDFVMSATTANRQTVYNAETKHRYYNHDHFADWVLECGKFEELITKPNALYVNTFKDGYMAVWSVAHIDGLDLPLNTTQEYPKSSIEQEKGTVIKSVYNVPLTEAYLLVAPNGEYKINKQNKR